jgi:hypothetical protein
MKPIMTQKTNKKILFAVPILAAILVGSLGLSQAFAENPIREHQPGDLLLFKGETEGWAVFNGEAYPASISIEGKATLQEDNSWNLVSTSKVDYYSGTADVFLKGNANDGKIRLTGTGTSEDGIDLRLILRGNYAPIFEQEDKFALDWKFAKIHVPQNGIKILLLQDGIIEVIPN